MFSRSYISREIAFQCEIHVMVAQFIILESQKFSVPKYSPFNAIIFQNIVLTESMLAYIGYIKAYMNS